MRNFTSLELAFIGDAIHTAFVRKWALLNNDKPINELHKICSKLCSAVFQASVLDLLELTDEEKEIVRKARNAKPKHQAKNSGSAEYKKATALEALIGYHFITKNDERLNYLLNKSIIGGGTDAI